KTAAEANLFVVNDDGAEHWTSARCHLVDDACGRSMLVTLDAPADVNGWLVVTGGPTPEDFSAYAQRIEINLAMLLVYPFVSHGQEAIDRCEYWANALRDAAADSSRLRSRRDIAVAFGSLHLALEDLHRCVADQFLAEVASRDVSLDRLPGQGFV